MMRSRGAVSIDWHLVAVALLLSLYGIAVVYSAGQTDIVTYVAKLWKQQLMWLALGVAGAFAVSRASMRMLEYVAIPLYIGTIVVLAYLLFFGGGTGTAQGTKSWVIIGGMKLGQPSELAKITVVLMLGKLLAASKGAPKSLSDLWKPIVIVFLPWALIIGQPDLGTGIVFLGIFFAMLFWSGMSWTLLFLVVSPIISLVLGGATELWGSFFLLLLALLIWYKPFLWEGVVFVSANIGTGVVAPLIWERLRPYQQARLKTFIDPTVDPRRAGYQVIQSQVAIGSGGWFGKGYTHGTQKRLAFLPAQHTDFVFSVVGEELGFMGVTLALALFVLFFLRIVRVSERASDSFSSLVAFGLLGGWFTHVAINVGMTLNLMPITGIPLPFFSYGGSFMLASWLAIGVLVRISHEGRGGRHSGLM
jgi:rod shape determining protein RodA